MRADRTEQDLGGGVQDRQGWEGKPRNGGGESGWRGEAGGGGRGREAFMRPRSLGVAVADSSFGVTGMLWRTGEDE